MLIIVHALCPGGGEGTKIRPLALHTTIPSIPSLPYPILHPPPPSQCRLLPLRLFPTAMPPAYQQV